MPYYEFVCDQCDERTELFAKMSEDVPDNPVCPECGKKMGRDYGEVGVVFKGQGWPGKEISESHRKGKLHEDGDRFVDAVDSAKKESADVLAQRRKGKRHFKEWVKHNKPKFTRYTENLKKGVRPK